MEIIPQAIEFHIGKIPISMLMSWMSWSILFFLSFFSYLGFKYVPKRIQNIVEIFFETVFDFANNIIGKEAKQYYPLLLGIFFFICVSNWLGVIPGFSSPTADFNVPISLAIVVFVYYNLMGFKKHGVNYLKHFMGPLLPWYFFPINLLIFVIEIISHITRPLSLSIRLFCNIFAKEALLGVLALLLVTFLGSPSFLGKVLSIAPLILRPIVILLALLIGFIQAMIFLILSTIYIAGAVSVEEEEVK